MPTVEKKCFFLLRLDLISGEADVSRHKFRNTVVISRKSEQDKTLQKYKVKDVNDGLRHSFYFCLLLLLFLLL